MANEGGVWRTIGGRKVFIRSGQSLSGAMKESGKFKSAKGAKSEKSKIRMNEMAVKGAPEKDLKEQYKTSLNNISKMEYEGKISKDEYDKAIKNINNNYIQKRNEYNGYKTTSDYINEKIRNRGKVIDKQESKTGESKNTTYSWSKDGEGTTYGYKNQYGTTLNQLQIDDEAKEYRVGSFKMKNDKTTTRKDFNSKVEELENAGYKKVDYWSERKGTGSNTSNIKNEKSTSDIMNEKIRNRGKSKFEDDLPKKTEIKEQGTSNRKEVSENIQAHILEYYTKDYTGQDISPQEAFVKQMDAMGAPTKWAAGKEIAKGGSYLIYNQDMSDFLDGLKINPSGKKFSSEKAFNTYTNLIGRESEKLYNRIQKNAYRKYMSEHPNSKMKFNDFLENRGK